MRETKESEDELKYLNRAFKKLCPPDKLKQAQEIINETTSQDYNPDTYLEGATTAIKNLELSFSVEDIKASTEKELSKSTEESLLDHNIKTAMAMSDNAMLTEILVEDIKKRNVIWTTREIKPEMYIYKLGIYEPIAETYVASRCRQLVTDKISTYLVNQVLLKIRADTYIKPETLFEEPPPHLVPVQNGILNTKEKNILPFNPELRFFNKLPITYDPKADCPKIKKFLKEVLPDEETIKVVIEMIGYCLVRHHKYHNYLLCVGTGSNGKDTLLGLIKHFLGIQNVAEISIDRLQESEFAESGLFKKLANISSDLSDKPIENSGRLKMLTGESLINANRKFLTPVAFQNYAVFMFACNQIPMTYDTTSAFFARPIIIDFPFKFLREAELKISDEPGAKAINPDLESQLRIDAELSGLLNLALEGLDRLEKNQGFSTNKTTEDTKNQWVRASNSFEAFFTDILEFDYESMMDKSDIRKLYAQYCRNHKITKVLGDKSIRRGMESRGISEVKPHGSERMWKGVKIRGDSESLEPPEPGEPSLSPLYEKNNFPYKGKTSGSGGSGGSEDDGLVEDLEVVDLSKGKDTPSITPETLNDWVIKQLKGQGEVLKGPVPFDNLIVAAGGAVTDALLLVRLKVLSNKGIVMENPVDHWQII